MRLFCAVAISVASPAVVGCGSTSDSGGGTKTVVTVIEKQTAPPNDGGGGGSDDSSAGEEPRDVTDGGNRGGAGGGKITVPDEVGKQLQAAQDDLQAHGLYNLDDKDATGQGRFQVFDRNWKVVEQDPPGGTKVSEDTLITLGAKKYTDP